MKKIYIVIFGLVLASCSLEPEPTTFLSDSNFYNTAEEANSAILHSYQTMTLLDYLRPYMNIPTTASEETFPKEGEGLNIDQFDNFNIDDRNQNLEQFFRLSYIGLNRANTVIEKTEEVTYDADLANKYQGEGLFLRSWHHFMLVRLFGEIPLKTSAVDELSEVFGAQNSSIETIYNSIISDLNRAIDLLPIEKVGGRADKVAAQALLSKVYITMASAKSTGSPSYEWVSGADTYYNLASQTASEVINNQSVYTFDPDLLHIYDVSTADAFNGPEHIFFIPQDRSGQDEGEFSKLSKFFIPANAPSSSFLPDGTATHGGFGVYVTELPFLSSFNSNDRRKNELVIDELYDAAAGGSLVWTPSGGESQPFSRKYIDPNYEGDKTSTHPYLLRYSDILLIYAEAEGPTVEGYNAVNQIRNRAGLVDLQPGLSAADFREKIIEERSFELAFEGHRLYDLRRTNKIQSVLTGIYGKTITNSAYFFPIPAIEGELNN
ncbi:RagB/SusD family nutrient uptake outer membrane protein [Flavivirga rizhaonensis]|uniref:RagB/SusD family nutrient uptake outer membrane protein n=1 Tax=Flavivirga rizhaonensis TaxID=2559571 RepID=A0A4V3P4R6_9FLAO|nr:RagB/SusD family nutrient uptake outer membrane protein [Flavivirga rizhaonensis]TGV02424.1 RagB/SusD family nutrient uptake outer membrane protein [Flavivirga rizhaonensis]